MSRQLPILCLIPRNAWIQPDWSSVGCEKDKPRKVYACLTSVYMYDHNLPSQECYANPVPIVDWAKTIEDCGVMIEDMLTFSQVKSMLAKLVPEGPGVFVYNGTLLNGVENAMRSGCSTTRIKTSRRELMYGGDYAASCVSSLQDLEGFAPEVGLGIPFTVGWFPADDPVGGVVEQRYNQWPGNERQPFLPAGPSPSKRSIELVGLGWDMGVVGLFMGDSSEAGLSPERLRELLGEDAILASVDVEDFWHWLEWEFRDEDMVAVDRELPFKI